MRAVVQRVDEAKVTVEGRVVGEIARGLLVFLGIAQADSEATVKALAAKIAKCRIFADAAGKMNLALGEIGGEVLVVSQFTLLADTRKGNRPSFIAAAAPEIAEPLYWLFCEELRARELLVAEGVFGAHMAVSLVNDGPVTIVFEL